jgi:hypothetical protein
MIVLVASVFAQSVDDHIAQATFFVKKGWYEDAERELEQALDLDPDSGEAHLLLAQVSYELLDAEAAYLHAEQATALLTDSDRALEARRLTDWLGQTFGVLEVHAPYPGVQSRLQLERSSMMLDPELKRFVDAVALEWTHPQALPLRVALPAGEYKVQGETVVIEPSGEAVLELPLNSLGSKGFAALQVSRLELSSGVGMMTSERASNLMPSWETQVGVSQPVRGWLLGVTFDYSVRSYFVEGWGPIAQRNAMGVGAKWGKELMVAGPLAVRPSVGYRYGYVPGIPFECVNGLEGTVCEAPDASNADPDMLIYAVGRAHVPYAELSIDWRRAGRTTATGVGVRVSVEHARGHVAETGTAQVHGTEDTLEYTAPDGAWTANGLRMLANFSHAF